MTVLEGDGLDTGWLIFVRFDGEGAMQMKIFHALDR